MKTPAMNLNIDKENNKIQVIREFAAPVSKVWKAWTQQELLDQWWAPKPWTAKTTEMDFREGGKWIYVMEGPDGEKHHNRTDFQSVKTLISFTSLGSFIDEKGNKKNALPESTWKVEFDQNSTDSTLVAVDIEFENDSDLEKILEMGFIKGFSNTLQNLDELLVQEKNV